MGRPSLAPGRYFRLLRVGYFEGLDAERGMAWRASDSLAVRAFLRRPVDEPPPDHSTISRTRRAIDLATHRAVFRWVQQRLVAAGLRKGQTVAVEATTLAANAAMRSIVRRDTGESSQEFLSGLARAAGIATPTRADLARLDRKRKKNTSNKAWVHPWDADAKIAKLKDGRTHLAHKAEHAVALESDALVAVTRQGADQGETTTIIETAMAATAQSEDAQAAVQAPELLAELSADKGYHRNQTLIDLAAVGLRSAWRSRTVVAAIGRRSLRPQLPVYAKRRRIRGARGRRLRRLRGEPIAWSFAHLYDTGGMRRTYLRPHEYPQAPAASCGSLQSRASHAPPDRQRHAARAAGSPGHCHGHAFAAPGHSPTRVGRDFSMAPPHRDCALVSVIDHRCERIFSGDHLHHGLLSRSSKNKQWYGSASDPSRPKKPPSLPPRQC